MLREKFLNTVKKIIDSKKEEEKKPLSLPLTFSLKRFRQFMKTRYQKKR